MTSRLLRVVHGARLLTRARLSAVPRTPFIVHQGAIASAPAHTLRLQHNVSGHSWQPQFPGSSHLIPKYLQTQQKKQPPRSIWSSIQPSSSQLPYIQASHLFHDRDRHTASSTQSNHFSSLSSSTFRHRPRSSRIVYTGRLGAGIEKKRSLQKRHLTSSAKSSNSAVEKVTWRDALTSPRKAITYSGQLMRGLIDWAKHMWAGAKLLAADVRVSSKILRRITAGKEISRRERNFIVKTGVDLARLVPFSLFLIIPLAEFALPFALRLFPNMLPSQFQDQMQEEENMKRRLKGRLELAKYLRDVVEEKAKGIKASDANSELKKDAEDLTEFLDAIRSGKRVDAKNVARFARLFNDELTIDGAVRPQLAAMCKYMGISPYGNDIFLRFKLRSRLNAIKKDDMEIMWEGGVNSLTDEEVAKACRDRGIREGFSSHRMREQLKDWLDLSQKKEIPSSLMIMSRAVIYTGPDATEDEKSDGLVETLSSLPEDVIMDVKKAADVLEESNVDRLAETLRQAKLIEIESEREARKEKEDEEKRKKKEAEELADKVDETDTVDKDSVPDESIDDKEVLAKTEALERKISEEASTATADTEASPGSVEEEKEEEQVDEEVARKERENVRSMLLSLEELSSDSAVEREREELRNLKLELAGAEEELKGTAGEGSTDMRRFKSLVTRLEREIERVDANVGLRMKLLDKDNDGLMSMDECKNVIAMISKNADSEIITETLERLDADADGNISKDDLDRVLREMQSEEVSADEASSKKGNGANGNGETHTTK